MSERRNLAIAAFRKHRPKSLTLDRLEALHCWGRILSAVVKDGLQSFWIDMIKHDSGACAASLGDDVFRRSLIFDERFRLIHNTAATTGESPDPLIAYYGRIDAPEYLSRRERRRLTILVCKSNAHLRWRLKRRMEDDDDNFDWIERIIVWWHCTTKE